MKKQDVLTKWSLNKLVVAKFVGVYNSIFCFEWEGKISWRYSSKGTRFI
jgi:hypothetical protein